MIVKVINAIDIRGTVTLTPQDPPKPSGKYVFQKTRKGHGNVTADPTKTLQMRAHVIPFDPQSAPQLTQRAKFAAAIAEWHTLTDEQKKEWTLAGSRRNISGINALTSARTKA